MTYRIFGHTLPDDKIHKFEDLTAQQKATLEQNLIEQMKKVPLRPAEEKTA